ncbi:alkene reductase [Mesorhizobium sp. B2-3-5]|uniref:alkene reductase n=1 Tax=Mesorhizobium sp. B2-3-5 TaxID=2589958 RepID=UPI001FEF39AC|nr:alkene reductase [Mesorhizobium sp. B2-3-5]
MKLFTSTRLGPYTLKHRVVLAPLTRMRSDTGDIPNDLMAEYYSQRASDGGLIISEGTPVSRQGYGYHLAAGIYSDAHIPGWKKVTDAVHGKGARMFAQLWHVGRQSHTDLQPGGAAPVAPSAIRCEGGMAHSEYGDVEFSMPRALEIDEIPGIVEDWRKAAARALEAGFDGVEIHGANGYLPDQFLQDNTNRRTDAYGGSIENRARFMLEVIDAAASVFGHDRVGLRLAPSGSYGDMADSNPSATFGYLAEQAEKRRLGYLHIVEPRIKGNDDLVEGAEPIASKHIRRKFKGTLIAAGGFKRDSAEAIVQSGDADLVAFGRWFIANPDLPERFRTGAPLNQYDRNTFYGGDARGYTDYTFHQKESELA